MDFQIDGVKVDNVQHNGVDIDEVQIDGETVWKRESVYLWTIGSTSSEIGFNSYTPIGGLDPLTIAELVPPVNAVTLSVNNGTGTDLFALGTGFSTVSPNNLDVEIEGYGTVTLTRLNGYVLNMPTPPALRTYLAGIVGSTIEVKFTDLTLVVQNVYANKETGGYNRATATATGFIWSQGSDIIFGWEEATSSGTGDVLPITPPSLTDSVILLSGIDKTLYEYALVSAPFTITSRTPIDTTTLGIGTWYDIPDGATPTLFAQCHGTENASGNSATAAGYLTSVWNVRLKGTTEVLFKIQSEIKVRAKSTL